jgi:hypothetical protein
VAVPVHGANGTAAALRASCERLLSLRFGAHLRPSTQVGPTMAAKLSTPPAGKLRWVGPRFAAAATSHSASFLQRFFDNSLACCPLALPPPVSQPHGAVSYLSVRPAVGCARPPRQAVARKRSVRQQQLSRDTLLPYPVGRAASLSLNTVSAINCLPLCC